MQWFFDALKGLFDVTLTLLINMPIAFLGKVEQPTYNGPVYNGPVYQFYRLDKETAVEVVKELRSTERPNLERISADPPPPTPTNES